MNDQSDSQLLRAYADNGSEPAFHELVRRHINLVHSAARRMVRDSHLAQDVSQGVFIALAKSADQLTERPVLSGWLHRTAQNIAAQTVRTDVRRRQREQESAIMNELLSTPDASWEEIAPFLDAALGELTEPDRDAILLRYFEKKSAPEMAAVLDISDEAAQKRVSRAVERLREFFTKRGVSIGAGGLVVVISANAVQAAPVGLAVTISAAAATIAGTAIASTATATATKAIAMTTLQKTIITATVAVLAGGGIYEARQAAQLNDQVHALQQEQESLAEQIRQSQRERDDATKQAGILQAENSRLKANPERAELLRLRGEVTRLRNQVQAPEVTPGSIETAAKTWLRNVEILKSKFEEHPERKIPELAFAADFDWLNNMRFDGGVEHFGDKEWRSRMAELRLTGKDAFAHRLGDALDGYIAAHDGNLPATLAELKQYYEAFAGMPGSMDDAILERYKLVQSGSLRDLKDFNSPIIIENAAPADSDYDTQFKISVGGAEYEGVGFWKNDRRGSCTFNGFNKVLKFKTQ